MKISSTLCIYIFVIRNQFLLLLNRSTIDLHDGSHSMFIKDLISAPPQAFESHPYEKLNTLDHTRAHGKLWRLFLILCHECPDTQTFCRFIQRYYNIYISMIYWLKYKEKIYISRHRSARFEIKMSSASKLWKSASGIWNRTKLELIWNVCRQECLREREYLYHSEDEKNESNPITVVSIKHHISYTYRNGVLDWRTLL